MLFFEIFSVILISVTKAIYIAKYAGTLNGYIFTCVIGKPGNPVLLHANLNTDISYVSDKYYDFYFSKTKKLISNETNINIFDKKFIAKKVEDTLVMSGLEIPSFRFLHFDNNRQFLFDSIALGYRFSSNEFNFVKYLRDINIIESLQFTIGVENTRSEDDDGIFYFGGFPEVLKKTKKSISFKVNPSYNKNWAINFDYIFIHDEKNGFIIEESYIDSLSKFITAPKEAYDLIYNNLKPYFEAELCREIPDSIHSTYYIFLCKPSVKKNFPNISFVIENSIITLEKDELFIVYGYDAQFLIRVDKSSKTKIWKIGTLFFVNFYTTFDYEANKITLYTEEKEFPSVDEYIKNKHWNRKYKSKVIIRIISKLLIVFLFLSIIWILYIKILIKKI